MNETRSMLKIEDILPIWTKYYPEIKLGKFQFDALMRSFLDDADQKDYPEYYTKFILEIHEFIKNKNLEIYIVGQDNIEEIENETMMEDYCPPKDMANAIWGCCFNYKSNQEIEEKIRNACFMIEKIYKIEESLNRIPKPPLPPSDRKFKEGGPVPIPFAAWRCCRLPQPN